MSRLSTRFDPGVLLWLLLAALLLGSGLHCLRTGVDWLPLLWLPSWPSVLVTHCLICSGYRSPQRP